MKLLSQTLSVLLMALFIQGCQLGQDDEVSTEADEITIDTLSYEDNVGDGVFYKLVLTENAKYADFTAKGDISEIKIYGDQNEINIESDISIEKISIFGDGNVLTVTSGVELVVDQVTVTGNSNSVVVYDIVSPNIAGESNSICELNTSAIVCL